MVHQRHASQILTRAADVAYSYQHATDCSPLQVEPLELTWYPGRHEQLSTGMYGSTRHSL